MGHRNPFSRWWVEEGAWTTTKMITAFKYQKCKNSGANLRNERLFMWKAFLHLLDSTVCSEKVCPNQKEKKRGNLGNIMFYQFELYCGFLQNNGQWCSPKSIANVGPIGWHWMTIKLIMEQISHLQKAPDQPQLRWDFMDEQEEADKAKKSKKKDKVWLNLLLVVFHLFLFLLGVWYESVWTCLFRFWCMPCASNLNLPNYAQFLAPSDLSTSSPVLPGFPAGSRKLCAWHSSLGWNVPDVSLCWSGSCDLCVFSHRAPHFRRD